MLETNVVSSMKERNPSRTGKYLFLLIFLFFALIGGSINLWRFNQQNPDLSLKSMTAEFSETGTIEILSVGISNLINNATKYSTSGEPHLSLNLKFREFQTIQKDREGALQKGLHYVNSEFRNFVKGYITYNGKNIPVKVRLKGSTSFHYTGPKWSIRVSVLGNNAILGMKEFALADPHRRAVLLYWLLGKMLHTEDIITPRVPFVKLEINGKAMGLYSVEEIPGKELIAARRQREGIILKYSTFYEDERDAHTARYFSDAFLNSRIAPTSKKAYIGDPLITKQFEIAANLLEKFKLQEIPTRDVFDIDKTAKWMAMGDLFNAWHGFSWGNMRYYYNPITSKIEPVLWDSYDENHLYRLNRNFRLYHKYDADSPQNSYFSRLFSDRSLVERYLLYLYRYTDPLYFKNRLDEIKTDFEKYKESIVTEYPFYNIEKDLNAVMVNAKNIRDKFLTNSESAINVEGARLIQNTLKLILSNNKPAPIILHNIKIDQEKFAEISQVWLPQISAKDERVFKKLDIFLGSLGTKDQLEKRSFIIEFEYSVPGIYIKHLTRKVVSVSSK
jgi:hypothetical protein